MNQRIILICLILFLPGPAAAQELPLELDPQAVYGRVMFAGSELGIANRVIALTKIICTEEEITEVTFTDFYGEYNFRGLETGKYLVRPADTIYIYQPEFKIVIIPRKVEQ